MSVLVCLAQISCSHPLSNLFRLPKTVRDTLPSEWLKEEYNGPKCSVGSAKLFKCLSLIFRKVNMRGINILKLISLGTINSKSEEE